MKKPNMIADQYFFLYGTAASLREGNTSPIKNVMVLFLGFAMILLILPVTPHLAAQDLTGYQVMEKAVNKSSWDDMTAELTLTLQSARGETRVRKIDFYAKEASADETRMLMRFTAPADVEGTGFLLLEHENAGDERYLYLPALRRVKRIAASGSGGNFMSSDFTYYDIGTPKLDEWNYQRLDNETIDGQACYVLECTPKTDRIREDTGYGKIIRWITTDKFDGIQAVYYDQSMEKKKELQVPEFTELKGVDFASRMIMHDVQIDHTSIMEFANIQVDTGIPEDFFSQRYLQRPR